MCLSVDMKRIMFVCYGNICRSVMAQCIMCELLRSAGLMGEFIIDSAATSSEEIGNTIYPAAARTLRANGIPIIPHSAKRLSYSDYDKYDMFVGMEEANCRAMRNILRGDVCDKVSRLLDNTEHPRDIADPWWTGDFDKAYAEIYTGCVALLANL